LQDLIAWLPYVCAHLSRATPRPATDTVAETVCGCGHGGIRKSSTSRSHQTWSVRPAAIAGVHGRHCMAEPVPLVGSGWGRGWRKFVWGKQKSLNL